MEITDKTSAHDIGIAETTGGDVSSITEEEGAVRTYPQKNGDRINERRYRRKITTASKPHPQPAPPRKPDPLINDSGNSTVSTENPNTTHNPQTVTVNQTPREDPSQIMAWGVRDMIEKLKTTIIVLLGALIVSTAFLCYLNWQTIDNARGEYERFRYATKQLDTLIKHYGTPPVSQVQ